MAKFIEVFSRDKFILKYGVEEYIKNKEMIKSMDMCTVFECAKFGCIADKDCLIKCKEIKKMASVGKKVRVLFDSTNNFKNGWIVVCEKDIGSIMYFTNPVNNIKGYLLEKEYVVREII